MKTPEEIAREIVLEQRNKFQFGNHISGAFVEAIAQAIRAEREARLPSWEVFDRWLFDNMNALTTRESKRLYDWLRENMQAAGAVSDEQEALKKCANYIMGKQDGFAEAYAASRRPERQDMKKWTPITETGLYDPNAHTSKPHVFVEVEKSKYEALLADREQLREALISADSVLGALHENAECRGDEDCDHCVATLQLEDNTAALKRSEELER